jgi:cation diffusion facilitator CzcD-associated flavoprotein CzcO
MTSIEYFQGDKEVKGPRVLVIGAGRSGLEVAEKLGGQGFEVTATKRTDPIGSMMEMITKKLTLMRIGKLPQRHSHAPHHRQVLWKRQASGWKKTGKRLPLRRLRLSFWRRGCFPRPGPATGNRKGRVRR